MVCNGHTCEGAYGMLHSLGHVIKNPRHLIFGIISFLFAFTGYYLFFSYKAKNLGIEMVGDGWMMELTRALQAESNTDVMITALVVGLIYIISIAFFYASLVFYTKTLHEGAQTCTLDAIKFGIKELASISLLSIAFVLFIIKMAGVNVIVYNYTKTFTIVSLSTLLFLTLITCFALVVQVSDHCGAIRAFSISCKVVFGHLWDIIVGGIIWALIFVSGAYLIAMIGSYCTSSGICLSRYTRFCPFTTLWFIIGFTTWVVFLTRIYRHSNKGFTTGPTLFRFFKH